MREIETTKRFERDLRRELRTDRELNKVLGPVIEQLAADARLARNLHDHALSGDLKGSRECHVKPDLLLIYCKKQDVIQLVRLGSHSELFR